MRRLLRWKGGRQLSRERPGRHGQGLGTRLRERRRGYSIAILLSEHARGSSAAGAAVFATDLHEEVLVEARRGAYQSAIVADVSPERLERYFLKSENGYRVRRELREIVLFACTTW